ncbi:hypothetical protein DXD08_14955 [Lachnospiraceae bacterium TF10-8AT]|nr:hypothetical protein DW659_12725 [Lachnospiraceae bacterium AM23-7LB]RHU48989.1 hypothetical protein DXD08_14955 [Lachnospiraceae bacterium TF10-8AT]RHV56554.1 hypothetical protein DXB19_13595 [Lachnospiraceae bacterium OM02-26]
MPRFLRIRSRLGALFEPQRVLFSIPLKASYARKAGGSAICKKREENSLAALPIVYLFFIIYSKSTVGQLQIKNLSTDLYKFLNSIYRNTSVPISIFIGYLE